MPMNMMNYLLADRDAVVADVEKIAINEHIGIRDAWEIVREKAISKGIGWMVILAKEQIQKQKDSVDAFLASI